MDRRNSDTTPEKFSTTIVLAKSDKEQEEIDERQSILTRAVNVNLAAIVFVALVVSGVVCFLWRDTAILRLEVESLSKRLKAVESQVEYCNALLNVKIEYSEPWDLEAADLEYHGKSSPSSQLASTISSDDDDQPQIQRWKRNASKDESKGKKKPKQSKQPAKSKSAYALVLEADQPTACKISKCTSLVGWKPSSWVNEAFKHHYDDIKGRIKMHEDGSYFIYAQVTYHTVARMEAFAIMVEDDTKLATCLTGVDYVDPKSDFAHNAQIKSCNTGIVTNLRKGQEIWLKSMHMGDKVDVSSMKNSNFWGIVRLPG